MNCRCSLLPGAFALMVISLTLLSTASAKPETWIMKDGTELFGEATQYDFKTKVLTIRKADGKDFEFDATKLSFSGKMQLVWDTPAFGQALKGYRPPILPSLAVLALGLAFVCLPTFVGLWGGAHVLGSVSPPMRHVWALLKLLLVLFLQFWLWFVAAFVLDPKKPVIPNSQIDVVILLSVTILGLLAAAFVVSQHYHQSFWKGLSITLLAGVFGSIVGFAMVLVTMFLFMRSDTETIVTKLVFEPFGVF